MPETIDWPAHGKTQRPRLAVYLFLAVIILIFVGSRTAISYWVDLLWFRSLGYGAVFSKTLGLEWSIFVAFAAASACSILVLP